MHSIAILLNSLTLVFLMRHDGFSIYDMMGMSLMRAASRTGVTTHVITALPH
jgi:hypothetical protein